MVKNYPVNTGDIIDTSLNPVSGTSPGGGNGNPLQYSCLENPVDKRSLAGYSPRGHKASDMTEGLSTTQHSKALRVKITWGN